MDTESHGLARRTAARSRQLAGKLFHRKRQSQSDDFASRRLSVLSTTQQPTEPASPPAQVQWPFISKSVAFGANEHIDDTSSLSEASSNGYDQHVPIIQQSPPENKSRREVEVANAHVLTLFDQLQTAKADFLKQHAKTKQMTDTNYGLQQRLSAAQEREQLLVHSRQEQESISMSLHAELEAKRTEISHLSQQLHIMTEQSERLRHKTKFMKQVQEQQKQVLSDAAGQVKLLETAVQDYEGALRSARNELERLQKEEKANKRERSVLRKQLEKNQEEIQAGHESKEELQSVKSEVDRLQKALSLKQAELVAAHGAKEEADHRWQLAIQTKDLLEAQGQEKQKSLDKALARSDQLASELRDRTAEGEQLVLELTEVRKTVQHTQDDLSKSNQAAERQSVQAEHATHQLEEARHLIASLRTDISGMKNEMHSHEVQHRTQDEEYERMRSQFEADRSAQTEAARLLQEELGAVRDAYREMRAMRDAAVDELEQLKRSHTQTLFELDQSRKTAEQRQAEADIQRGVNHSLNEQLFALNTRLTSLVAANADLQAQVDNAQKKVEENTSLAVEADSMTSEQLAALLASNERLASELDSLTRSSQSESAKHQYVIAELQGQLSTSSKSHAIVVREHGSMEGRLTELRAEMHKMNHALAVKSKAIDANEKALAGYANRLERANSARQELSHKVSSLTNENLSLNLSIDSLKAALADNRQQLDRLMTSDASKSEELVQLRSTNAALEVSLTSLREDQSMMVNKLARVPQLESANASLTQQLEDMQAAYQEKTAALHDTESRLSEVTTEVLSRKIALSENLDALQKAREGSSRVPQLESQLQQAETAIATDKQNFEAQAQASAALQEDLKSRDRLLQETNEELVSAQQQRDKLQTLVTEMRNEHEQMRESFRVMATEAQEAAKQVRAKQEEIAGLQERRAQIALPPSKSSTPPLDLSRQLAAGEMSLQLLQSHLRQRFSGNQPSLARVNSLGIDQIPDYTTLSNDAKLEKVLASIQHLSRALPPAISNSVVQRGKGGSGSSSSESSRDVTPINNATAQALLQRLMQANNDSSLSLYKEPTVTSWDDPATPNWPLMLAGDRPPNASQQWMTRLGQGQGRGRGRGDGRYGPNTREEADDLSGWNALQQSWGLPT